MADNKGARSYKGEVIGDSMAITINFKWLLQIIAGTAMLVYAFWQYEVRIQGLERNMIQPSRVDKLEESMELALEEIEYHELERQHAEAKHVAEMEERMLWYESELNLNPFSWGKKKK